MTDKGKENILTKEGYKNTRSRKAVIHVLENAQKPLSAEDIFLKIRECGQAANLSTVYRTLELMENKGLVEKTLMNDSRARFELLGKEHKHRLICTNCSKMVSIDTCPLKSLEKDIGRRTRFDITGHRLELYGICPECREE